MKGIVGMMFGAIALAAVARPYADGDVVVFLGDSITHGGRYHEYIADFYRTRYPEACIRFVNSGIGGDTASGARPRVAVDVTEYAPTHVALHFGMNDIGRGSYGEASTTWNLRSRAQAQEGYRTNFRLLVEDVRKAVPAAKLTYLTPTPYDDTAVVTNAPKSGWASFNNVGCNAGLSLMAGFVIASAAQDKVDVVDWYSPLNNCMRRHQKENPHFSLVRPDRVHPAEAGHSIMAWEFLRAQGVSALVSEVEIDAAAARAVGCANASLRDLACRDGRVAFTLLAKALPFPVCAEALPFVGEFEVEKRLNREVVRVKGLAAGDYVLKIDGTAVGTYSAEAFGQGVSLGFNPLTPQYRQAQSVAKRNAELRGREATLRNHHSARWFFGRKAVGAPVDDVVAFRAWYEANGKSGKGWSDYFVKYIPGYLEYWPKYKAVRAELWKDQDAVRQLAKPVPHAYEIVRVGEKEGR